jgi:hypothetical protein
MSREGLPNSKAVRGHNIGCAFLSELPTGAYTVPDPCARRGDEGTGVTAGDFVSAEMAGMDMVNPKMAMCLDVGT